ncbi:tyrosine-type recombinase/integrase [Natrarchaeobaculum sulfurireducens]
MTDLDEITLVTGPSEATLNERQLVDYRSQRRDCLRWLLHFGKDPDHAEGYAFETVRARASRMDMFYRWVWETEDRYVSTPDHRHADAYLKDLAYRNTSNADKSNHQKAVQMLFKWRTHEHGIAEWTPSITFSASNSAAQPKDFFTREERGLLRDAALEYGSIPGYGDLSPSGRDRWRAYLAQRFEKPKSAVTSEDWERANGWKIPSLVATSLDTGLRPIEVARARTYWVDVDNQVLRIPKDESSKNRDNWVVSLHSRTADILHRWINERDSYLDYDETDTLWLTREGNTYRSSSLKYLLQQLCEIADIDTTNRTISWYTIRHSVGTYMTREEGLAAAQMQLRHQCEQTTMKYDQAPVEDRRDALDRMG